MAWRPWPRVRLSGATPRHGPLTLKTCWRAHIEFPPLKIYKTRPSPRFCANIQQQPLPPKRDHRKPDPSKASNVQPAIVRERNGLLLRYGHGRAVVVVVGGAGDEPAVEQGGGQGVRERAGLVPGGGAEPVGARGVAAAGPHRAGGVGPLPGADRRRRPHRARHGGGARRLGRGGPRCRRRGGPRPRRRRGGAPPRRAVDRGGAQAVSGRAGEVRARRLEEHLAVVGEVAHANAGGQPRAEVLHPPGQRRQPRGHQAQEHP